MRGTKVELVFLIAWPFILVLAFVFPPLFLFVPIRAPAGIVFLGLVLLVQIVARGTAFIAQPSLRGPPLAR
jgi:hypothetical protein